MSWSSNNGDDSPWGRNAKEKSKSSYNGSGNNQGGDDFFDNFQDKLKNFSPKKPCLAFRNNINNSINMGFKWILQSWYR